MKKIFIFSNDYSATLYKTKFLSLVLWNSKFYEHSTEELRNT